MTKDEILRVLSITKRRLASKYGLNAIGLFGSYAEGMQRPNSDIDILVEFNRPIGMEIVDLVLELEKLLGGSVDLVSKKALKPELLKAIEQQINYV